MAVVGTEPAAIFKTYDGGDSWQECPEVADLRADHLILGPADGPDRNGRIEESFNSGETWDSRRAGLEFAWTNKMVEQFVQLDDELFAVLSDGELISASLDAMVWRSILGGERNVRAIAGILEQ